MLSDAERAERLESLGQVIAGKRKEAVDARKSSGIEDVWMACEEAYLGIDDMNRHEFAGARWAKPATTAGGLTSQRLTNEDVRSSAFVRLTSRYVDSGAAKLGEILLPIDEKAFSFEPTPDPDLVKQADDLTPLIDAATGRPAMRPLNPGEQAPAQPVPPSGAPTQMPPMTPAAQGAAQMVTATVADKAQQIMDQAQDRATRAETRIYDWMTESKYPAEARKVVHDSARIGVGVLKGPFPDTKEATALTHVDGAIALQIEHKIVPAVRWVDPWNIFPDESCGEDIHEGEGLFERDFLSTKRLRKLKDQEGYLATQIDQVIEEGPGKCYADGGNPADKKNHKRYEIWYYYGTLTRDDMELAGAIGIDDIPEDQDEVHAIVSLVNDTVIKAIINPLDSGKFPYRVMTWSRRPGHWAGVGVGEQLSMPQRMCNASTRALLNNAGLSSGAQIVIDQLAITPADGSYKLTPNKVWYMTEGGRDVRTAFQAIQIPSVVEQMMSIIEYAMKLAEEATGIPLVTQGQVGPTTPQTFGQAELQDNNSHTWLRSIGYRYDDQITEPLVTDFYEWLLLDPVVPDDEKGDFRINAHGSIAMVERAIQETTLMGLLQASQNPAFKVDPAALFSEYLKSKRLDPRKIQYSPEKQAQMDAMPPPPPLPVMVEQVKGQNAIQQIQAKTQAEIAQNQQEMAHEQQMLQTGGMQPHMAQAMARIQQERLRGETAQTVEASRANAELARAEKEKEIAFQNGQFDIQKMQLQRDMMILEYTLKNNMRIEDVKGQLAQTAIQEHTKRELAAAEIQLAANQGAQDRAHDMAKHATSLIRDEVSTPVTP